MAMRRTGRDELEAGGLLYGERRGDRFVVRAASDSGPIRCASVTSSAGTLTISRRSGTCRRARV